MLARLHDVALAGILPESLKGLEAVETLDEHETVAIRSKEDWGILALFQNASVSCPRGSVTVSVDLSLNGDAYLATQHGRSRRMQQLQCSLLPAKRERHSLRSRASIRGKGRTREAASSPEPQGRSMSGKAGLAAKMRHDQDPGG